MLDCSSRSKRDILWLEVVGALLVLSIAFEMSCLSIAFQRSLCRLSEINTLGEARNKMFKLDLLFWILKRLFSSCSDQNF